MARVRPDAEKVGSYFVRPTTVACFTTGCKLLDCVLGGKGWPLGRIVNVVGDKATGKTLLAIEACCNFARVHKDGEIRYREVEAAFDKQYAGALGLPLDRVVFPEEQIDTIEELFNELKAFAGVCAKRKRPGLYILDSLDALSSKSEMDRDFGQASYGGDKAKDMSKMFRQLIRRIEDARVTVMIISQVRDKLGVTFGRKVTRSGGRALDFYASHVIWLAQLKRLQKTKHGIGRPIGVLVRAMCEKNKVGPPFRDCQFPIMFGYGIDDVVAGMDWLLEVGREDLVGLNAKQMKAAIADLSRLTNGEYQQTRQDVSRAVSKAWYEIERDFAPGRSKY